MPKEYFPILSLTEAFHYAVNHWKNWRENYTHPSHMEFSSLPMLKDLDKFKLFCHEFSVYRGPKPKANGPSLREHVFEKLNVLTDPTGPESFFEAIGIRKRDGRWRKDTSAASKLLRFWQLENFAAIDQYSSLGLATEMKYVATWFSHRDYSTYLEGFNTAFKAWEGKEILESSSEFNCLLDNSSLREHRVAVQRSVFDIWLMALGGRKAKDFGLPKLDDATLD